MSGHSKWHSIKFKKGLEDAKRGKVFTKHAKLVAIAAREGGSDPSMNPALRTAIENARAENMPNANIERAIKKGAGEDKDAVRIDEIIYEGYGPCGIALIIQCLTDNKNRTVSDIKHIMSKNGANMGESGSVMYLFNRRGVIVVNAEGKNPEQIELAAIDAGAEDIEVDNDAVTIYTSPTELNKIKDALVAAGYKVESAKLSFVSKSTITISDEDAARKVLRLMEEIEDNDDVGEVYSNFDIDQSILSKII